MIQTKKVPLYENEKEKGKKFSKKADAKPKKKEHNSLYTPW